MIITVFLPNYYMIMMDHKIHLFHCVTLFKEECKRDRYCHKTKAHSYISGRQLNTFLKKDVMTGNKEYRVCNDLFAYIHTIVSKPQVTSNTSNEHVYFEDTMMTLDQNKIIIAQRLLHSTFEMKRVKKVNVDINNRYAI